MIDIFLSLGLLVSFIVTRVLQLTLIPIFTDEAIYLRWSQIMAYDASLRYLPLVDGKPPLFMWLTSIGLRFFPNLDPLLVIRLVSVGSGLFGLAGIFFTSYQLFHNKKVSYLSAIFYILIPFTFFYDRFGLADSLLAGFGIWSLGLGVILAKKLRLDVALLLGITIGLGLLTKTPALFFYLILPLGLIWKPKIWKFVGLWLVVIVLSQSIFSILRLFPLFHMIAQKNAEFSISLIDFIHHPFTYFISNSITLFKWEFGYLTPLVSLIIIFGFITGLFKNTRQTIVLSFLFLAHFAYMSFFNKSIFPRFLLTFTPGLLILAAVGIEKIPKKFQWGLLGLILLFPIFTDIKLLFDPPNAPIPDGDSNQYINRWPAGYGINDLRTFFNQESKKYPKITVGTEGTFGLMPYALQIYQKEYPNVEVKDYWPLPAILPIELTIAAKSHPTYFIVYQQQQDPPWPAHLVAKYQQGKGNDYLRLYRIGQ